MRAAEVADGEGSETARPKWHPLDIAYWSRWRLDGRSVIKSARSLYQVNPEYEVLDAFEVMSCRDIARSCMVFRLNDSYTEHTYQAALVKVIYFAQVSL